MKNQYRTGDQALVRQINLSIVFNRLWTNAPLSRAQLAGVTGLNKTTISSLVHELLTKGFVREAGQRSSHGGRPATLLELNPRAGCMVGVEIGGDFISAILTNFRAEIEWRHYESTESGQDHQATIERTKSIIQDAIHMADRLELPPLGIGVGVPGLVDLDTGVIVFAPNLEWHDVPLRAMLAEYLPFPILVDNDANLSALGEYYFGTARGIGTFIHIAINVGLGGGVFLNGQPFRGVGGYAGEFGHMTVQEDGLPCKCGSFGCWETVVSSAAVINRARAAVKEHPHSRILELAHGQMERITLPVVIKAAEEADKAGNWGSVSQGMRQSIKERLATKVDWKKMLRYFVRTSQRADKRSTPRRLNKRFPKIHPGKRVRRQAKIAISIDQSGSVDDGMLAAFYSELDNLAQFAEFTVIPFDTQVATDKVYVWKKGERRKAERVLCGGTCFDAPTRYVNEGKFDGHIVLTDMCAPKPIASKCQRMWLTTTEYARNPYFSTNEVVVAIDRKS